MMHAAFILGLYFIGVPLEHYHESNMWHNYHVTEVNIPTPRQETEQVSSKLHEKAFQDQVEHVVERQDHNIHLHHTVISVRRNKYIFRLLCMYREHLKKKRC